MDLTIIKAILDIQNKWQLRFKLFVFDSIQLVCLQEFLYF